MKTVQFTSVQRILGALLREETNLRGYLRPIVLSVCILALVGATYSKAFAETDNINTSISVRENKVLLREPIQIEVSMKNISNETQGIKPIKPSVAMISRNGDPQQKFHLFETWREQISDIGIGPIEVQPGNELLENYWLLLGRTSLRDDWEFLFPKPGHYTVSFPDYGDEDVKFDVVSASDTDDISAGQIFSVASAAVFLGEEQRKDKEKGVEDLQTICSKHASGKYAPYAALALARHLWREEGNATFDLQKYYKYVDVIIEKHPAHYLSDKAYYMRAKGLNKEGKKDRVVECLDALRKQHPKSKYARIIESEFEVKKRK